MFAWTTRAEQVLAVPKKTCELTSTDLLDETCNLRDGCATVPIVTPHDHQPLAEHDLLAKYYLAVVQKAIDVFCLENLRDEQQDQLEELVLNALVTAIHAHSCADSDPAAKAWIAKYAEGISYDPRDAQFLDGYLDELWVAGKETEG